MLLVSVSLLPSPVPVIVNADTPEAERVMVTVEPRATMMVSAFPILTVLEYVALPPERVIVSPAVALVTQVCTLVESGVLVQFGLEPLQAARAEAHSKMTTAMIFTA